MLKGSQGRLFGKLNEVVDKQIELKHAVEGLRGWRKVTLANVLDRTAMVVMKEEPIMPQAPGRDNEDMRSELSYYMDRGDLCGNPPSGDWHHWDPTPHLSFSQFVARRHREHEQDHAIRQETGHRGIVCPDPPRELQMSDDGTTIGAVVGFSTSGAGTACQGHSAPCASNIVIIYPLWLTLSCQG